MDTKEIIKRRVIKGIEGVDNIELLLALEALLQATHATKSENTLTQSQKTMLKMAEDDIKNGRVISQEELTKQELAWLLEK